MCRSLKLSLFFVMLLSLTLTACAPATTPVPSTPTNLPPTHTLAPTAALLPTATPRLAYQTLPMPKPSIEEKMFDVGGHKMNLECYGTGSPTVVIEQRLYSGLRDRGWDSVIPNVAAETRMCLYDRFNAGASDAIGSHTFEQAADEWHALMQAAKIEPPYILVGLEFGGFIALTEADRYPAEIEGVMLIDSAHLPAPEKWLAVLPTPAPDDSGTLRDLRDRRKSAVLPKEQWDQLELQEGIDLVTVGRQQIQAIKSLGHTPLIVLVAAAGRNEYGQNWPGIPLDVAAKLDEVWIGLQKEYVALSSDSQLVIADHSGPYVQIDQPELVVSAIFNLLDKARQK
jgi:pimeloyl-ACP methyl ester carboxylesterase